MALTVNLAAGGVVGVTGLSASEQASGVSAFTADVNTVFAITGSSNQTVNLPNATADQRGDVIIIKNLTAPATPGATQPVITIGRESGVNIDGQAIDRELDITNQVVSFYFIGGTIGWLAGPATI